MAVIPSHGRWRECEIRPCFVFFPEFCVSQNVCTDLVMNTGEDDTFCRVCSQGHRLFQLKNPWSHLRWKVGHSIGLQVEEKFFCAEQSVMATNLHSLQGKFSERDTESWTPELQRALNYDRMSALQYDNGQQKSLAATQRRDIPLTTIHRPLSDTFRPIPTICQWRTNNHSELWTMTEP